MPAKGVSKKIDRDCLVCGENTRIAHLGIDTCRACAVFYRRAKRGNHYVCRSSTGGCRAGKGINCKRCRFDHIERFLKQSDMPRVDIASSSSATSPETSEPTTSQVRASTPTAFSRVPSSRSEMPILERLKTHYRTMSLVRLNAELHARKDPPHPLEISLERGPFYPATINALAVANRVLFSAMLEFAAQAFPEFGTFDNKEKFNIIVNNFYRFRLFEGCYRAGIVFPDDMNKKFGAFTLWMSVDNIEFFYSDAQGDIAKAVEHVNKYSNIKLKDVRLARELIQRVNPCLEEFLVVFALKFWSLGDMTVRDEIAQIGDRYREAILKELHAFYREKMQIDDYASRLGQLMMFLPMFDRSQDMKEHFEMLNLLGLIPEDSFTYQLQKTSDDA